MTAPAVPAVRDIDDITDHELVARIRAGDDRAFECLYRRYHRRIAGYIQGMVHDHARAEDITQDVFMSALRRMRDTDRPIAFKPWIYEIAKNACIDQFRRSRRAEEVSYDAEDGLGSADYGRLVTKDPSPEVRYETKQQLDHLRGAFGGLSETHHEILVMRELEGLSYREIGERMGMTRPAVESTLFRARRRLSEEYEELVTGERCQRVQGIIAAAASSALGARDRRRVARHVSYCQPCLRHARASGMDAGELVAKPLRAKVAGFLPLPAFLKKKLAGSSGDDLADPRAHPLGSWSTQMGAMDPNVVSGWGKAAAAAATIAIAGVGAGVVANPPESVQAAVGAVAVGDRLGGGAATPSVASAPSRPAAAASSEERGAADRREAAERSTSTRSSSRKERSGDSSRSGDDGRTSGGTKSSGDGITRERTDGIADAVSRLGSGPVDSAPVRVPKVEAPQVSAPEVQAPSLPAPKVETPKVPVPAAPAPAPTDPVGGATKGVDSTGSAVTGAAKSAEGILAGE